MIKPVQLLVLSLTTLAVSTLHTIKVPAPVGVAARLSPPVAAATAVQTSLAVASERQRLSSACTLDGARDRSRSVTCSR